MIFVISRTVVKELNAKFASRFFIILFQNFLVLGLNMFVTTFAGCEQEKKKVSKRQKKLIFCCTNSKLFSFSFESAGATNTKLRSISVNKKEKKFLNPKTNLLANFQYDCFTNGLRTARKV
jgi:hypothetical protein